MKPFYDHGMRKLGESITLKKDDVKIIISQNGADDQDTEEVLLSDSEKFTGEIINSEIY